MHFSGEVIVIVGIFAPGQTHQCSTCWQTSITRSLLERCCHRLTASGKSSQTIHMESRMLRILACCTSSARPKTWQLPPIASMASPICQSQRSMRSFRRCAGSFTSLSSSKRKAQQHLKVARVDADLRLELNSTLIHVD